MSTWGIVVFLVYLAIHIVSVIAKEATKKKEREKQMEAAERRRIQEAHLEPPTPEMEGDTRFTEVRIGRVPDSDIPTIPPAPVRAGRVVDNLAARRKEQLEKLRQGRPVQTQSSPAPYRRPDVLEPVPVPPSRTSRDEEFKREARMRRERTEAKARAQRQADVKRQREQLQKDARRSAQKAAIFAASDQRDESETVQRQHAVQRAKAGDAVSVMRWAGVTSIRGRLRDRNSLREIFILKELLDPPLALR